MVRTLLLALPLLGAVGAIPSPHLASAPAPASAPCAVRFVLQVSPRQLAASGYCRSLLDQPARYFYQLTTEHWGRSHAISTQAGSFDLGPHQEAELAQAEWREVPGNHYRLRLRVYDDAGHLLAQDSVRRDL